MRRADIKPGVVYALQRSENYEPEPVVVLNGPEDPALWRLSQLPRVDGKAQLVFKEAPSTYQRPSRGVGYPSARLVSWRGDGEAGRHALAGLTIEDFREARSNVIQRDVNGGAVVIQLGLLTSLSQVAGVYDEVAAERRKAEELRARRVQEHADRMQAALARRKDYADRFAALGFTVNDVWMDVPHGGVMIRSSSEEFIQRVLEKLEAPEGATG